MIAELIRRDLPYYDPVIVFALVAVVLGMIPFLVVPALRR